MLIFHKKTILVLAALCCLGILSCQKKNYWKQPTDLAITLDVNKTKNHPNSLDFERGTVVLERITIAGDRSEADDIYFEKSFPAGLTISLDSAIFVPELYFQIPQGTYTSFNIKIYSYKQANAHSLMLDGKFKKNHHDSTMVKLNLEDQYIWELEAVEAGKTITFDQKIPMILDVNLDAPFWFGSVGQAELNNAQIESENGQDIIFISENKNQAIFDLIKNKIARGVKGKSKKK